LGRSVGFSSVRSSTVNPRRWAFFLCQVVQRAVSASWAISGAIGKSFHSLRHFKATSSYAKLDKEALAKKLAASPTLEEIAALLGPQNENTTKGYVH
jgi:integrase